jgi:DNA-directed RNA polymerase specialized sigma subunit
MTNLYNEMTDEQLAALYQKGDEDAFTTLFLRYQKGLGYYASKAMKRYQKFPYEEFFGYFQEQFIKIAQKFDVNSGVYFAKFCSYKFPKLAHNYVRGKLYPRKDGVEYESARDRYEEVIEDISTMAVMPDNRFTFEHQQDTEKLELYQYLSSLSDTNANVIALLVQGYNHEEIALAMGRTGSGPALRMWTARVVKKMKQQTLEFYKQCGSETEIASYVG